MRVKKGILLEKLGKKFVAYDNETSNLHELNETAFLILQELKKGKAKQNIIKKLSSEFKVSQREAEKDFRDFLKELESKELIEGKI